MRDKEDRLDDEIDNHGDPYCSECVHYVSDFDSRRGYCTHHKYRDTEYDRPFPGDQSCPKFKGSTMFRLIAAIDRR